MNTQPVPVEELLAHREWVTRFAAALVRNRDDADDLAQDAFASALRAPPRSGASIRGWFAAVMRNRVRDAARRRTVTAATLPLVARDEAAAALSPGDLAERAETERLVISLVLELPDDFRDAVLMRFWQGMEPAEIAKLRGIPAATVRTRIHRGLAEVREKLDRRDREGRWRAVLLAGAADEPASARRAASATPKIAAAVLVVALAGGTAWMLASGPTPNDVAPATPARDTASRGETAHGVRETERTSRPARPAEPVAADAPIAEPAKREVNVRVLGLDGTAIANAELWALSSAPVKDTATRIVRAGATSADGTARFAWPFENGPGRVLARTGTLSAVSKTHEMPAADAVEIRLEGSWVLAGQVEDEDGRGIDGAELHLQCELGDSFESVAVTRTRPGGRFEFEPLPESLARTKATLEARAGGFATEWVALKEARAPEPLRITLKRALEVTGRVVDESGQPLADVEVDFEKGDNTFTDAGGRFRSGRLPAETIRIGVLSEKHAAAALSIDDPAPGLRDLGDIVLHAGEPLRGRVLFADGSIAADVWVGIEDTTVHQFVRQRQTDAEGRFVFKHLGAGPLEVHANGPNEGPHAASSVIVKDVRPGPDELVVTLSAGRSILVTFADAETGKPLTGSTIVVAVKPEDGGEGAATSLFDRGDGTTSVRMTMSREGPFLVTVKVSGYADFGPERVVVGAAGDTPFEAKLRKR